MSTEQTDPTPETPSTQVQINIRAEGGAVAMTIKFPPGTDTVYFNAQQAREIQGSLLDCVTVVTFQSLLQAHLEAAQEMEKPVEVLEGEVPPTGTPQ